MDKIRRPLIRYHGGKWKMADFIIQSFPPHRVYVEPFGGGGSVMLRKPRSYAEIYNDLDDEVVNIFRIARDRGEELMEKLIMTPFARAEFTESYEPTDDPLERARRSIIRSFMGFGSNAITARGKTGFRSNSNRSGTTPAQDWKNYVPAFEMIVERLRGVVIENKDAMEVMLQHDSPDTLHYVDPPYVMETRSDSRSDYRFEMTDDEHRTLADFLHGMKGFVVLSGYPSPLYKELFADWRYIEKSAYADGAKNRIEALWISRNVRGDLFQ